MSDDMVRSENAELGCDGFEISANEEVTCTSCVAGYVLHLTEPRCVHSLFMSDDQFSAISGLFPDNSLQLIYSGTRDGFRGTDFHSIADGQAPTITVVKNTHDKLFGGYTDIPWASAGGNIAADLNTY